MMIARSPSALLVLLLALLAGHGAAGMSVGFIVDTTSSMTSEISALKRSVKKIVTHPRHGIVNFILSPFNDPGTGPVTSTSDPKKLLAAVHRLKASGGGDCPEMSMTAILNAAKFARPHSVFFIYTDGLAKDWQKEDAVLAAVSEKKITLVFVMTGCCNRKVCTAELYKRLGQATHGGLFRVEKKDVYKVMIRFLVYLHGLHKRAKSHKKLSTAVGIKQRRKDSPIIAYLKAEAKKKCHARRGQGLSAASLFLVGCTRISCSLSGDVHYEEMCDASPGLRSCKPLHSAWRCIQAGRPAICECVKDDDGVLIKVT